MTNLATTLTSPLFYETDTNNNPLAGGQVYTYQAGTLIPLATYTDATLTVPNPNPVILDTYGKASIWLGASIYKINVTDVNGVQHPDYPVDNIQSPFAAVSSAVLLGELANTASNIQGAGLVGFNSSLIYPANTVGSAFSSYALLSSSPVFIGSVTATNFIGSGAGLTANSIPITSIVSSSSNAVITTSRALSATSSAAPTGTASTTSVMMAAGGAITPILSTRVLFTVSGQMANATSGDGATIDLRYGTGTAPINGAAVTGTLVGIAQTATSISAAQKSGFSISYPITGLTIGTAYWFDISLKVVTGGTATITGISASAMEV
jgi:hypothetical protein